MDKLEPSKRVAGLPRTSVKELSIFDQAMADQRKRRQRASIPASLCGPSMEENPQWTGSLANPQLNDTSRR